MMLFGELKHGGVVSVNIDNNQIVLIPKVKTVKVVDNEAAELS
jgi:hypothetical protein